MSCRNWYIYIYINLNRIFIYLSLYQSIKDIHLHRPLSIYTWYSYTYPSINLYMIFIYLSLYQSIFIYKDIHLHRPLSIYTWYSYTYPSINLYSYVRIFIYLSLYQYIFIYKVIHISIPLSIYAGYSYIPLSIYTGYWYIYPSIYLHTISTPNLRSQLKTIKTQSYPQVGYRNCKRLTVSKAVIFKSLVAHSWLMSVYLFDKRSKGPKKITMWACGQRHTARSQH